MKERVGERLYVGKILQCMRERNVDKVREYVRERERANANMCECVIERKSESE